MPEPEYVLHGTPRHAAKIPTRGGCAVTKRRVVRNTNPRLAMTR